MAGQLKYEMYTLLKLCFFFFVLVVFFFKVLHLARSQNRLRGFPMSLSQKCLGWRSGLSSVQGDPFKV